MTNETIYIESLKKQFTYYKTIADKAIAPLSVNEIYFEPNENANSIAVIMQHIIGNLFSRWTDFFTTDGEKYWRNRDAEFENQLLSKTEILDNWEKAWQCLFLVLNDLNFENLSQIIYIRNEGQTVIDAINRQLAHYPYHIGQMIYVAKLIQNENWISLSIPKNNSKDYNFEKFKLDKKIIHFTEAELKKLNSK